MSTSQERTISSPAVSVEHEQYWAAANAGTLLVPRCQDTGKFFWYPRQLSPFTLSQNVEWVPASGQGVIYSYSVLRRADPPYAIAYVTLAEGVTILTNIVECDFDALAIGQAVELTFRNTEDGQKVPVFKPAA